MHLNYDPTAIVESGQCSFVPEEPFSETDIVYGCTYEQATNYNSNATNDDGSCTFTSESCSLDGGTNPGPVIISDNQVGLG